MNALVKFIERHTSVEASGVDVMFLQVRPTGEPCPDELRRLLAAYSGNARVDVFDHREHSFIELGAWLGSQELALRLMGLGSALGVWQLLTPRTMLGDRIPADLAEQMAGMGLVTVVVPLQAATAH